LGGENPSRATQKPSSNVELRAPLPGLLIEMQVSEGDHVEEEDVVAVLESMKMNLELRAPRGGVVQELCAVPGRQVAQDEVLAIISPNGTSRGDDRD
jgi:biotin carboxyl carrier protein